MNKFLLAIALLSPACCVHADEPRAHVLTGATVIDVSQGGRGQADIVDAVVVLRGADIVAVGRRGSIELPADADVVDVHGQFIVPGLVDGFAGMQSQAEANAQLYEGVTTLAATGDDRRGTLHLAADPSPHVYAIDSVGSTDDWSLLRNDPRWRERLADGTTPHELTAAETHEQLQEISRRGIRAIWLGHNLTEANTRAILAQARELHIATYGEFIATPYEAGIAGHVSTLLHMTRFELGLVPFDPGLASDPEGKPSMAAYSKVDDVAPDGAAVQRYGDALRAAHVTLMPTFSLFYAMLPAHRNLWHEPVAVLFDAKAPGATNPATGELDIRKPERRAMLEHIATHSFALDTALIARGATVLAASGSTWQGTEPGLSLHTELELLVRAGLTPRAALAAATGNYAEQFGWTELGKIEAGRRADLLVLARDPREDVRAVDAIAQVWLSGQLLDRQALLKP